MRRRGGEEEDNPKTIKRGDEEETGTGARTHTQEEGKGKGGGNNGDKKRTIFTANFDLNIRLDSASKVISFRLYLVSLYFSNSPRKMRKFPSLQVLCGVSAPSQSFAVILSNFLSTCLSAPSSHGPSAK